MADKAVKRNKYNKPLHARSDRTGNIGMVDKAVKRAATCEHLIKVSLTQGHGKQVCANFNFASFLK